MSDEVNHPAYYGGEDNPYEVIKVAEAWGFDGDAYLFNVLKYIARPDKGSYLQDLRKAKFYLDRKIRRLEAQEAKFPAEVTAGGNGWRERFFKWDAEFRAESEPKTPVEVTETVPAPAPAKVRVVYDTGEYEITSYPDWTVETLTGVAATVAELPGTGWKLALGPDATPFKSTETVKWLTENWPPDKYTFYLVQRF